MKKESHKQWMGRKFIGIEKDPHFFNMACRRLRDALREDNTQDMFG